MEYEAIPGVTLVLGGARSGKSRFAEGLVTRLPGPWTYVATAQAWDDEMRDRIRQHQADRAPGWTTVEAPLDLADALSRHGNGPLLVDCLTLWLTNVMLADRDVPAAFAALEDALAACTGPIVLVGNEVGLGIVPDNALARAFRDHAGRLHQRLAVLASQVFLTVAGLPLKVK
ncbi:bifunctional adenosylcobinamide kinase/adenosylcobinamide-phosphate guanylyltransferase [Nitrospirillum sp. BR 11752]|uniref:bifunctional adenosylcobinamide kinase/adenosylcobinamide-phosphate guanylyltransferase n=1 Tax=Nitrospirillum sp. BR 11752 TaxID=3104293 RepID=UPI002EB7B4B3|nr:bifunctional adenosylcobinamide kinase/adenosylcobinamide-phosphate guanylyltransferase [Nitrospirillum sp. BR 11752]